MEGKVEERSAEEMIVIDMARYNELMRAEYELRWMKEVYPETRTLEERIAARNHFVKCLLKRPLEGVRDAQEMTKRFRTKGNIPKAIEHQPTQGVAFPCPTFPVQHKGRVFG